MALTPAGLDPVKPQVLHPRLALPSFIRCQPEKKDCIRRGLALALWACPRQTTDWTTWPRRRVWNTSTQNAES